MKILRAFAPPRWRLLRDLVRALAASGLVAGASAQLSVGGAGTGVIKFDTAPRLQDWATESLGGDNGGAGIVDAAGLDAQVQTVSAAAVTNALAATAFQPPSQNNYARWNSAGGYLQSRIGNVEFTVLRAALFNDTGTPLQTLGVNYRLGGGSFSPEQVPGFRGYFSLTGQPGSWQVIPAFCTGVTGEVSTVLAIGPWTLWQPGTVLYLLWADDNGPGSDGYYTIDDFQVRVGPVLSARPAGAGQVELSWPVEWWNHLLEVSTRVAEPDWQPLAGAATTANGQWRRLVATAAGPRFFRTRGYIVTPGPAPR